MFKQIQAFLLAMLMVLSGICVFAETDSEKGLIGKWDCDEGRGSEIQDSSLYNIKGKLSNVTWEKEGEGYALKLSAAANSYISFDSRITDALSRAQGVTFAAWVKNTTGVSSGRFRLFGAYINNTTIGTEVYMLPAGIVVGMRSSIDDAWMSKTYAFNEKEKWFHVAVVTNYSEKTARLYINGYEAAPASAEATVNFGRNYYDSGATALFDYMGGNNIAGNSLEGFLDEMRVYKRPLDKTEIKALASTKTVEENADRMNASVKWDAQQRMQKKLKNGIFLFDGNSNAYVYSKRKKIDTMNFQVTPTVQNGVTFVPVRFIAELLECDVEFNAATQEIVIEKDDTQIVMVVGKTDYTVNKTQKQMLAAPFIQNDRTLVPLRIISEIFSKNVFWDDRGLIALSEESLLDTQSETDIINELVSLFQTKRYEEPYRNHAATRTVIAYSEPSTGVYLGSPSMIRMDSRTLLATHDYFGKATGSLYYQAVYKSTDNGKSWEKIATVAGQYWSTLFEHRGNLYLLGTTGPSGSIVIRKSTDGGYSWTEAADSKTGLLFPGNSEEARFSCGPNPVILANGRLFRAFEDGSTPTIRDKKALVVSVPEEADLLNADNWTMSNKLLYDSAWQPKEWNTAATIWIEGNMVQEPDGGLRAIYRLETNPTTDKAAMLKVKEDGSEISFDPQTGFIEFPGGMSLFNIKYDPTTKLYLSLVNNNTDPRYPRQRNVLSLSYSKDLVHWEIAETVLVDNSDLSWEKSVELVGFQYVDWLFDGNDLILAVRESDGKGKNFHDANTFAFYRLKDYKKYIKE